MSDGTDDRIGRPVPAGRIALIRHGETEWSVSGRHTSVTDVDLTAVGERQARGIPAILAGLGLGPRSVLVSPRRRARRTAELAGLGAAPAVINDLVEWDYGRYEGLTTAQIRGERPAWDLFTDGCPGVESPEQVARRADRVLDMARSLAGRGDVALVAHGHISRALTVRWVNLPVSAGALIAMDAAAVTVLGSYHGDPIIEHANVIARVEVSGVEPVR